MAHIEKRGRGRWRARYRTPDGRERSKTFDRRADSAESTASALAGDIFERPSDVCRICRSCGPAVQARMEPTQSTCLRC